MPIQYTSILGESRTVRSKAGIFDVSHMGRVNIHGPGSVRFLNRVLSLNVPRVRIGQAKYNLICNESGGIIDDCILYRLDEERFLLIPNAGNTSQILGWLSRWSSEKDQVKIENTTSESSMIALQGPQSVSILENLTSTGISNMKPFTAIETTTPEIITIIARTGYTGEDGFEMIFPQEDSVEIWETLIENGAMPCGLGARDVLRLESGLLLHGSDMDASINPYEAGLDKFVDPDKDDYIAGPALRRIRNHGASKQLIGFNILGRGIPRHGYRIIDESCQIGHVTSGGYSPTLDRSIGLGYVPTGRMSVGSHFQIDVRGRAVEAVITSLPFYSRRRNA